MAYLPIIACDGNGWFIDGATGDVVFLYKSAVVFRASKAGAIAAFGSIVATGNVSGANLSTAGTVTGAGLSVGAAGSLIKTRKTTLTAANLKALAGTPITLVPAVAAKFHQFLGAAFKFHKGTEVLVEPSAPDDPVIRYVNGAGVIASTSPDAGALIAAAADAYAVAIPVAVEGAALAALVNVPLVFHNTGEEWTGNAHNDATLAVTVAYIEHDVS